ncbi:MAG: hypothetical protein LBV67_12510 [Streptococcaceae bacterium]|jgi:hypothetical protein|nr:hypothetical protein [Streptococcaceae bacterium]
MKKKKVKCKSGKFSSWVGLLGILFSIFATSVSPAIVQADSGNLGGVPTSIYLNVQGGLAGGDEVYRYNVNGRMAVCIEPNIPSYLDVTAYSELPVAQQKRINLINMVGETMFNTQVDNDAFVAQQWLTWEDVGVRAV